MENNFKTPMLKQYGGLKAKYPGALLFFRLGDFYELFFEDAKVGAEVMGITLTKRARGADGKIPMCGVPFHAVDNYLGKLVKAGYKVALAEQVTDPAQSKGLVEREVVRVITPGTVLNEKLLEKKENNFILCVMQKAKKIGFAFADLGTGTFQIHEVSFNSFESDLGMVLKELEPRELILPAFLYENVKVLKTAKAIDEVNIFLINDWDDEEKNCKDKIKEHFSVQSLEAFGIEEDKYSVALVAAYNLLKYLKEMQKNELIHISKISSYFSSDFLKLDTATVANLEIFKTVRGQSKKGSLINLLDRTKTAMGGRLFRKWLLKPLAERGKIIERQKAVEAFLKDILVKRETEFCLEEIVDIERLISRLALGLGGPRDLDSLRVSLEKVLEISRLLEKNEILKPRLSWELVSSLLSLTSFLGKMIREESPISIREGGFMREGVSEELDELRKILSGDKEWLLELEQRERQKTGIDKLKIKNNKVFGYYIEISKANLHLVPDNYMRKQTLVNAERFIIPELKLREDQVFEAEGKINQIEYELFQKVVEKVLEYLPLLQKISFKIAEIDCLVSLAQVAEEYNFVKPEIIAEGDLVIRGGRHPVVEDLLIDSGFVANDTEIREKDSLFILITGPNMSGKSTYLRQVAIIVLMSQVGSFVPVEKAMIPVVDQIFTRVGASDSLGEGQSTFLVEMVETANILNNATPKSLVIFDEIGRGTSTFDGMSIAWAVIEYMLSKKDKRAKTLFATHYHELTVLADKYKEIKNMQMAVAKENGEIVFLRKVIEGAEWESYGVEVAKMAGLPAPVIKRAQEILYRLKANQNTLRVTARKTEKESGQMKLV